LCKVVSESLSSAEGGGLSDAMAASKAPRG